MRWTQVWCLICRLTNSCFHHVVFLSDEIFLFVFFGGKKIKCPPPGCSDPKYFVLGSCLPRTRPRLFFFVSLEIFFWVLFLKHLFFSEWLLYFFGINFFSFGVHESRAPGKIGSLHQGFCLESSKFHSFPACVCVVQQKFHEIEQKLNVLPVL